MSKRGITNYFKVYAVSPTLAATIVWATQDTVAKVITLITGGTGEVLFDTATGIGLKKEPKISAAEIHNRITELDRDLFGLRNELAINRKLEKPHLLRAKKREKARLLTTLTQMKGVA